MQESKFDFIPEKTQNCKVSEIRLANLERAMEYLKESSENQSEIIARVDTVMEFIMEDRKEQKETNKEQREINKAISETLNNINDNLTGLNKDVGNLEQRFTLIEKSQEENSKKGNINIVELFTDNIKTVIGTLTVGGIIYVLAQIIPKLVE